jgi:poly(3-hydroxybutyrate) depolymerase
MASASLREALIATERAAREVTRLVGGKPGRWTLDRRVLSDEAAAALLSLVDRINECDHWRTEQRPEPSESWRTCKLCTPRTACVDHAAEAAAYYGEQT